MTLQRIKSPRGEDEYVLLPVAVHRAPRREIDSKLGGTKLAHRSVSEYVPFVLEGYVQNPVALARQGKSDAGRACPAHGRIASLRYQGRRAKSGEHETACEGQRCVGWQHQIVGEKGPERSVATTPRLPQTTGRRPTASPCCAGCNPITTGSRYMPKAWLPAMGATRRTPV